MSKTNLIKELSEFLSIQECKLLCTEDVKRHTQAGRFISSHCKDYEIYQAKKKAYEAYKKSVKESLDAPKGKSSSGRPIVSSSKSALSQKAVASPDIPIWLPEYGRMKSRLDKEIDVYVKHNTIQYYLAINCWLGLVKDNTKLSFLSLLDVIKTDGLLDTIDLAKSQAEIFVNGGSMSPLFEAIYDDVKGVNGNGDWISARPSLSSFRDPDQIFLLICRYLKRFTPAATDSTQREALNKFKSIQRSCRDFDETHKYYYIKQLRGVISELMPWKTIIKETERAIRFHADHPYLSPGSSTVGRGILDKVSEISFYDPNVLNATFGDKPNRSRPDPLDIMPMRLDLSRKGHSDIATIPSDIRVVPKDINSGRLIAMEPPIRYSLATTCAKVLDAHIPSCIPLHDQEVSRGNVMSESRGGNVCTVDSSSASDSLSKTLFRAIFPVDYIRLIDTYLPTRVTYDGTRGSLGLLQSFATSGNPLTFILLSIMMAGIAILAVQMGTGYKLSVKQSAKLVVIYGDDIEIPEEFYDVITELLPYFGVDVNQKKSYADGFFRESCGMDVIDGSPVASLYWPRCCFDIEAPTDLGKKYYFKSAPAISSCESYATSIISHEHELLRFSPTAALFLTDFCKKAIPGIGIAYPGTSPNAIWSWHGTNARTIPLPSSIREGELVNGEAFHAPTREVYSVPRTLPVYWDKDSVPELLVTWAYTEYLRDGPLFLSDEDEAMGISTSRLSTFVKGYKVEMTLVD